MVDFWHLLVYWRVLYMLVFGTLDHACVICHGGRYPTLHFCVVYGFDSSLGLPGYADTILKTKDNTAIRLFKKHYLDK